MNFLESWIKTASALFPQALAGEPDFHEAAPAAPDSASVCISARVGGDLTGHFLVLLPPELLEAPLLGETGGSKAAWIEILRETAEAAAADLLTTAGQKCFIEAVEEEAALPEVISRAFEIRAAEHNWILQVSDQVRAVPIAEAALPQSGTATAQDDSGVPSDRPGIQLLLDVELEATLRFGCRELQLGEILGLGPGDVVQLDRHISDPVDLIVGDKIVAHGEVVLVNGNFGLRVTDVAAPRERLESIRCLF
ncbi:MAG: FliM/FliN family flagellar motor switch protein [Acidobacteriota bacterium]